MPDPFPDFDFWELPHSRRISQNGRRFEYFYALKGTSDPVQVIAYIEANTDAEIGGLPREIASAEIEEDFNDFWRISLVYQSGSTGFDGDGLSDIGDERTSWSTKGGQIRVFQATEHIADYANTDIGEDPPNHKGAINWTNSKVEGVEIPTTEFAFQVKKLVAASAITIPYLRVLFKATNTTNDGTWRGYLAGELRIDDISANQRDAESWELVFVFVASENLQGITIGDINDIDKGGHEYLWSEFVEIEDSSIDPPTMKSILRAVHVERVFESSDYTLLGLEP